MPTLHFFDVAEASFSRSGYFRIRSFLPWKVFGNPSNWRRDDSEPHKAEQKGRLTVNISSIWDEFGFIFWLGWLILDARSLRSVFLSRQCRSSVLRRKASSEEKVSANEYSSRSLAQCLNAKRLNEGNRRKFSPSMSSIIQSLGVSAVVNRLLRNFDEQKSLVQGSILEWQPSTTHRKEVIALQSCCVSCESPFISTAPA